MKRKNARSRKTQFVEMDQYLQGLQSGVRDVGVVEVKQSQPSQAAEVFYARISYRSAVEIEHANAL